MAAFVDHTGETFNGITITKELHNAKVLGQCIHCGSENVYWKNAVIAGHYKSCGCFGNPAFKDKTNQEINGFRIIEELGGNLVKAVCLNCNCVGTYNKYILINRRALCNNQDCIKSKISKLKDQTGIRYGNLEIVKELGNEKVLAKCLICNQTFEYCKGNLVKLHARCKNSECIGYRIRYNGVPGRQRLNFIDRTGNEYNDLKIIKDTGEENVQAQCNYCKQIYSYNRDALIKGGLRCKNPECINKRKTPLIDTLGETFGNFVVMEELGNRIIKAKCIKCGHIDSYIKSHIKSNSALCRNCGINETKNNTYNNIKDHIINNVIVIRYEYKGRDDKIYYTCRCNKCGEEILLSYKEIFDYNCNEQENNK